MLLIYLEVPCKRRRTSNDQDDETGEKVEEKKTPEAIKPKLNESGSDREKSPDESQCSPPKKTKKEPEPRPSTSKEPDEPCLVSEEKIDSIETDYKKAATSVCKGTVSKTTDDKSSEDEVERSVNRSEGGRASGPKERPTMLDTVVKHAEAIFKMLRKE